ncbi:hypothetical protein EGY31_01180 [Burkholderia multivorans]|uniref:hypothetical protein n=1 Tax=Burkholderia ubonensis TaxID=101571 RepID=UPI000F6E3BF5|nr:hypothetical protein [Burkholderia ubonensis]AYZ61999.1 hypothetical protein EGY31_01180 [Burkholderia multivorans]VWB63370.1 type IV secretion protein Rhs [Burkholderia ubonensis]
MLVNKVQPTSAGLMPQYPLCTPDRWGLRHSDADPERRGQLTYPVARDYAKAIQNVLVKQVQWGNAYFGPSGTVPALTLRWPFNETAIQRFFLLIRPVIAAALTDRAAGFGIPIDAVPINMGLIGSSRSAQGQQGIFKPNDWSLILNTEQLAPMFRIEAAADISGGNRAAHLGPLKMFADTLYHEARHCQQWFWMYALVQQHPDNFETLPSITKWPTAVSGGRTGLSDEKIRQAHDVIALAAKQAIPNEPAALASLKRMAIAEYVYTLNIWRHASGPYVPPYLANAAALEDEFARARELAKELLQNVGMGGTPIDIDAMVAEPSRCYYDYTVRPWENDAFVCGDMASAYWDAELGLALRTYPADQCSRAYELADRARRLESRLPGATGTEGGQ